MTGGRAALLAAAALVAGTAIAAAPPPATIRDGEAIYHDKCVYCHDAKGWGTRALALRTQPGEAILVNRKELPAALTEIVVRRGIGSMPGFTPTELSDAEIARVAKWLDKTQSPEKTGDNP